LRGVPLKFRPLEMDDKRFPPLNHGAATFGFFYFEKQSPEDSREQELPVN
jgi:hypothetical protein